jgi:hypothetical protein
MHVPFRFKLRRTLIAGAAVLVLGAAAVGIASAQSTPTPTATAGAARGQAFLDALAKRLGITTTALQQAITGARQDAGLPAGNGFPGGRERGPGGPGGPRGFGPQLDAAAQVIGISADQLRQELPGKSLAQVATAHGKNPSDVTAALKNAAHQRIDQAVSAGRLTADQGNQQKQQIDQRIDQQVNQAVPQGGFGPGRGPRGTATPTP